MTSSDKNRNGTPAPEGPEFIAWGTLAGALVGAGLGIFIGHWLAWAVMLAVVGWLVGAVIDRTRR
jgi:divalent metal cation (Fe/Co/Zn/Cd) transporter